jgi:hypothetical protein
MGMEEMDILRRLTGASAPRREFDRTGAPG